MFKWKIMSQLNNKLLCGKRIQMLHMAPGEKSVPRSILFDKYAEELSFPTIYGGKFRTYKDGCNATSFMQATSELRRTDRRATDPQQL